MTACGSSTPLPIWLSFLVCSTRLRPSVNSTVSIGSFGCSGSWCWVRARFVKERLEGFGARAGELRGKCSCPLTRTRTILQGENKIYPSFLFQSIFSKRSKEKIAPSFRARTICLSLHASNRIFDDSLHYVVPSLLLNATLKLKRNSPPKKFIAISFIHRV